MDTHFSRAIRKYGADNFYIELIDTAINQEELTLKEQEWIKYYKSTDNKYGYNETDADYKSGGNTYKNKTASEMAEISNKISKAKLGGLNHNSRKIKCLNVNTQEELVFDSVSSCKRYFNESTHRFITTRVLHQTQSLYKEKWAIAYYEDEYYDFTEKRLERAGYFVSATNLADGSNTLYRSIRQLCGELGYDRCRISKMLKEKSSVYLDKYVISILD